jgi:phosphoribosylcarboxyaminoimidazole (NCAIR) mutase
MKNGKRVVRVIVGSESDLSQMYPGLCFLHQESINGTIDWDGVQIGSIHWNTLNIIEYVRKLGREDVDVIIIGAGAANHLTGTCDAVLRRTDHNTTTHVIGVAFESSSHPKWNETAIRSIVHVPGTCVIFNDFNGMLGFTKACHFAVFGDLPPIELPQQFKLMKFLPKETAVEMADT